MCNRSVLVRCIEPLRQCQLKGVKEVMFRLWECKGGGQESVRQCAFFLEGSFDAPHFSHIEDAVSPRARHDNGSCAAKLLASDRGDRSVTKQAARSAWIDLLPRLQHAYNHSVRPNSSSRNSGNSLGASSGATVLILLCPSPEPGLPLSIHVTAFLHQAPI